MPVKKMLGELQELHRDLLAFGTGVADAVAESVNVLREPHAHTFMPEPVWGASLSEHNHRVVERCHRIVILYQPVASDFRQVTSVLHAASELERIGALAAETAEHWANLAALPTVPEHLPQMAESVSGLIHGVLDAYEHHETVPTRRTARTLTEIADCAESVTEWLTGAMKADPAAVEPGLSLFAVVRNLRAIADHATRFAEALALVENGSFSPATRTATGTETPRLATGRR